MTTVALISTPWPIFKRPSIQLGSLKAYLLRNLQGSSVDTFHFYLDVAAHIGYDTYSLISDSSWLSESLYACLLFEEQVEKIQKLWDILKRKNKNIKNIDLFKIKASLSELCEKHINSIDWERYLFVGFSICFSQLMSSLFYMKMLKKLYPDLRIIAGGSHCSLKLGQTLINTFDWIDLIIQGEGEKPLLNVVEKALKGIDIRSITNMKGLIKRGADHGDVDQIEDINNLPVPDYDDYFKLLKDLPPSKRFFPRIPLEASRGCWYRGIHGNKKGCTFCNLNLQWKGYRYKSKERLMEEIRELKFRYNSISFSFMDNLIPPHFIPGFFEELLQLGEDLRLFLEARAGISKDELKKMYLAGVDEIQVGIEALSTSLLKKMNKGVTAIKNIETMKAFEEQHTPTLRSNIILDFPSSDQKDVEETLNNLQFVRHLTPLKPISFWLGYASDVYFNYDKYGLVSVFNHPYYSYLFPKEILKNLILMIQGYKLRNNNRHLWRKVREKVVEWNKNYKTIKCSDLKPSPILSYYDAKDFLVIIEKIGIGKELIHKLTKSSRDLYVYCDRIRHVEEIKNQFSRINWDAIERFLNEMIFKKLMFKEGEFYLSLAVNHK